MKTSEQIRELEGEYQKVSENVGIFSAAFEAQYRTAYLEKLLADVVDEMRANADDIENHLNDLGYLSEVTAAQVVARVQSRMLQLLHNAGLSSLTTEAAVVDTAQEKLDKVVRLSQGFAE